MKRKILFGFIALTVATTFLSCKKNNKSIYSYSPPNWLIGNWNDSIYTSFNYYNILGFKITNDDIIQISGGTEASLKIMNENVNATSQQEINGNTYHITISDGVGLASNYYFVKVSSNKVKFYTVNPNLNPDYTVLLRY